MKTLRGFSYILLLVILAHPKGFAADRPAMPALNAGLVATAAEVIR